MDITQGFGSNVFVSTSRQVEYAGESSPVICERLPFMSPRERRHSSNGLEQVLKVGTSYEESEKACVNCRHPQSGSQEVVGKIKKKITFPSHY